ncbi:hypothetical protein Z945_2924 [Sulfitobacter noctilucae]|uniref:DUF4864 domain-containing protein n=1 Tax=Sulfitobacter noctilucae TaxID=1342302 RepID=UPI00046AFE06|nr:DUF4864 domain-containing protein [Sulfitobacter noctilucae]KIN75025.1 hypothetical protein Z945_2924 [Sulfitobacter noctilucae]
MLKAIVGMLGGIILSVMLTTGAAAQQTEIESTINGQLDAFKADNFEQAFTYATPTLQRLFQSPENFERMVTSGYPMVWRPAEVTYLELKEYEGSMWQKVQITDQKGFTHVLLYRMQQTEAGWRIGGVQILDAPGATA